MQYVARFACATAHIITPRTKYNAIRIWKKSIGSKKSSDFCYGCHKSSWGMWVWRWLALSISSISLHPRSHPVNVSSSSVAQPIIIIQPEKGNLEWSKGALHQYFLQMKGVQKNRIVQWLEMTLIPKNRQFFLPNTNEQNHLTDSVKNWRIKRTLLGEKRNLSTKAQPIEIGELLGKARHHLT